MKLSDAIVAILLGVVIGLLLVSGWVFALGSIFKAILGG